MATSHNGSISGETVKTISTIIGISMILVGVAAGYGSLQQRLDDACIRLEKMETKFESYQQSDTAMQVRLSRIETDLAYIRAWIEKQERANAVYQGADTASTSGQSYTAKIH